MNEQELKELKSNLQRKGRQFQAQNEKLLKAVLAGDQSTADGIIGSMKRLKQEATALREKAVASIEKTFSPRLTEDAKIRQAFTTAAQGVGHGS